MAQKRKNSIPIADIISNKTATFKKLEADLERLQEEHHNYLTAYEKTVQRLQKGLHQSKLNMPSGPRHLDAVSTDEPRSLHKRKATADEFDIVEFRVGTDARARTGGAVYARLSPNGVRFHTKSRGKKRQRIDFGDIDLRESLQGEEESTIEAMLVAQMELENGDE